MRDIPHTGTGVFLGERIVISGKGYRYTGGNLTAFLYAVNGKSALYFFSQERNPLRREVKDVIFKQVDAFGKNMS